MDVILLQRIKNLGKLGDKVSVKAGYGRNFLIPQGKAVAATEANTAAFEARRAELEKQEAEVLAAAQARAEQLNEVNIVITAKIIMIPNTTLQLAKPPKNDPNGTPNITAIVKPA